jgi:hypothetical protein
MINIKEPGMQGPASQKASEARENNAAALKEDCSFNRACRIMK